MIGASRAIEGPYGFLFSYSKLSKPDQEITKDLGSFWETSNTAIKPYPCCRLNHAPIEAAYDLRKRFPSPGSIPKDAAIIVTVGRKAFKGVGIGPNKVRPTNLVEGQFSLPFQFAVALLYGRNDWDAYKLLNDEKVLELCQRITVRVDESIREGSLRTVAQIGDESVTIDFPLGEPENPIRLPEVENKVRPMLGKVYGMEGANRILKLFNDLPNQADLVEFMTSLRT